ncbi:MAG: outer membrane protein assembly factor BamD [Cyclobacteriaceae bacterium]|nr:outer membrane protein assembly factor BamD [Cyclobacteriaceae bacterium]
MRKWVKINLVPFLFIVVLTSGCQFRKIEKSEDWRVKYEAALQYYEGEDYYRASILFEQILPIVRGLPEGEQVQFYLSYCQYHQNLFLLASHHFKTFYESYGRSEMVQEARYMHAYSLYADSPESNLDQSSSLEALTAMQSFLNRYPDNKFGEEAVNIIEEIQQRLEKKGFDNAFHYFKLKRYTAAIVALDNFKFEYPDSKLTEEADYYKILAQYNIAEKSILSKQSERYSNVREFYEKFIDRYPDSIHISEVEKLYINSLEKIQDLAKK